MASADKVPMLEEGHRKLTDDLKRLKNERPEIVEAIEAARAHGDLSETPNIMRRRNGRGRSRRRSSTLKTASAGRW